jgi:hypothetical protein
MSAHHSSDCGSACYGLVYATGQQSRFTQLKYCPPVATWSPQGMQVLRQCKVPQAEVMFITIQRENMNKAITMLKLSDVCS